MSTAANLLVILTFLSGLYVVLGLIAALVEKGLILLERPRQRRAGRRAAPRRRRPRRPGTAPNGRSIEVGTRASPSAA
ncbi:MAG: hypothetical protein MUC77_16725 [Chromatiaceae bacterium]|jgi:hypothetical protein|nr:hypothetical protein [Chromatiaceae bacterium]